MSSKRLTLCLKYRLRGMTRASLIFLVIFALVDLVLPVILFALFHDKGLHIGTGADGEFGLMPLSYAFLFSTVIFLFVGFVSSFKEDFDFLLALSNTRLNQYLSSLLLLLAASGSFFLVTLLLYLPELLVQSLVDRLSLRSLFAAWTGAFSSGQLALTLSGFSMVLAIFLTAGTVGLAVGIFAYRFGRRFTIPFWIVFGTSFIIVPILIGTNELVRSWGEWYIGSGRTLQPLVFAGHLAVTDLILLVLGGLAIRRLPQNS